MSVQHFLLTVILMVAVAKLCGALAERFHQTAVLGELAGGILVGSSGLNLIHAGDPNIHLLGQLGVILLLFLIGLETDLSKLLSVGGTAMAVAVTGVICPLLLGFAASRMMGMSSIVSFYVGATLTATSVGLTVRILSDLGCLQTPEAHVILGAAILDDIIGLILLSMVGAFASQRSVSLPSIAATTALAVSFLSVTTVVGRRLAPVTARLISRQQVRMLPVVAAIFAMAMALLADRAGSALVIGAFAAGVILSSTEQASGIARDLRAMGDLMIPIFFVSVGSAVNLRELTPGFLGIGLVITLAALVGKMVSGLSVRRRGLRRLVIGAGMIPRGEVGLIFAQIGLAAGVFNSGLYSAVTLMVIATALITPWMLKLVLANDASEEPWGVQSCDSDHSQAASALSPQPGLKATGESVARRMRSDFPSRTLLTPLPPLH